MQNLAEINIKSLLKYKNIFVVAVVLIILLFSLSGLYANYQRNLGQIAQKEKQVEEREFKILIWQEVNEKYDTLRKDFLKGDPLEFKRQVEEQARGANIIINSLGLSQEREDFYHVGIIDLEAASSYNQLVNFIINLEKENLFVERIVFNQKDKEIISRLTLKSILIN